MSEQGELRVALVHDELTRRGGAENVVEELIRLYPTADIYALYAGRPQITVDGRTYPVHTTFIQQMPRWFREHPSRLLPLLSFAAEQLDLSQYDVVISSASGFAKAIVTRANVPHISYCHTPTRYLWETDHVTLHNQSRLKQLVITPLIHSLRVSDFAAAQRVDYFVANSAWTAQRIAKYYRRDSQVIYPPVDTTFFTPAPQLAPPVMNRYFICVGRLTPSKRFEQAIAACEKLGLPLIIVGTGHHANALKRSAGRHTRFVGKVSQDQLRQYYRHARALLQPGEEDFGIAAVEAQSCGTPVIACGRGGATETVRHQETGLLYDSPTVEALAETLRLFLTRPERFPREVLQRHTLRFTTARFRDQLSHYVTDMLAKHSSHPHS